ncbi:MAG: diguanylate cyclase domain-containing protein [Paracoccaceae bacterium]
MTSLDTITLLPAMLDRLMPMHLRLDHAGHILSTGPTLAKLVPDNGLIGQDFFGTFSTRRLARLTALADLHRHAGEELHLNLQLEGHSGSFRGLALPVGQDGGMLVNLSFGIGVIDAVRRHNLTHADFAPTDLAVEMLYVVEAKTTVMEAWKDLTLRVQGAKRAAEERALTDPLTGLGNRRALDLGLSDVAKSGTSFGLMHIDLDYFKQVNDTLGHAAGDHVLRQVAAILRESSRGGDIVARVGGDEFVLILQGLADPRILGMVARRIIDRLTQPIDFEGRPCRISASIGVTISTFYNPPEPEQMMLDADEATYASKRAGRARAEFHAPVVLDRSA